jgi:hypothetical protein
VSSTRIIRNPIRELFGHTPYFQLDRLSLVSWRPLVLRTLNFPICLPQHPLPLLATKITNLWHSLRRFFAAHALTCSVQTGLLRGHTCTRNHAELSLECLLPCCVRSVHRRKYSDANITRQPGCVRSTYSRVIQFQRNRVTDSV